MSKNKHKSYYLIFSPSLIWFGLSDEHHISGPTHNLETQHITQPMRCSMQRCHVMRDDILEIVVNAQIIIIIISFLALLFLIQILDK